MNAEILQMISMIAYILAVALVLLAVVLFFVLDIRSVIDELSGKKEERQIRELREQNRHSDINKNGQVLYSISTERKRATADMEKTHKLFEDAEDKNTVLLQSNEEETSLLTEKENTLEEQTTLLEEQTMLLGAEEGTTLLGGEEDTTLLVSKGKLLVNHYHLILDEIVIHTKERI